MKSPPLEGFTVEWGLTARLVINKFNFPCSTFKNQPPDRPGCVWLAMSVKDLIQKEKSHFLWVKLGEMSTL